MSEKFTRNMVPAGMMGHYCSDPVFHTFVMKAEEMGMGREEALWGIIDGLLKMKQAKVKDDLEKARNVPPKILSPVDERVKRLVRAARALQAGQCLETMVAFSAALDEFEDAK